MSTLVEILEEHLTEYGWRRRPSGRYVHPDIGRRGQGRRRPFTAGEAMTLTQAMVREQATTCDDCGSDECPGAAPTAPMPEVPTP